MDKEPTIEELFEARDKIQKEKPVGPALTSLTPIKDRLLDRIEKGLDEHRLSKEGIDLLIKDLGEKIDEPSKTELITHLKTGVFENMSQDGFVFSPRYALSNLLSKHKYYDLSIQAKRGRYCLRRNPA